MPGLILALGLLGQQAAAPAPPPSDPFSAAVERFVALAEHPDPQSRAERLGRRLGCPRWECRDDAEADLKALGPRAYRALVRAELRSRDPEVVGRARRLRRAIYCEHCRNGGACPDPIRFAWDFAFRTRIAGGCATCPPLAAARFSSPCGACGRDADRPAPAYDPEGG